jgi:uncharacterized membrane protein YqgA involved in biofilm formation
VSPAATMRGDFNQLSVRNVRAEICALVLSGASGACVILSVLAALQIKRSATRHLPEHAGFSAC